MGLTSWLFTQRDRGVELGTTENIPDSGRVKDLNQAGTSRFRIQRPKDIVKTAKISEARNLGFNLRKILSHAFVFIFQAIYCKIPPVTPSVLRQ